MLSQGIECLQGGYILVILYLNICQFWFLNCIIIISICMEGGGGQLNVASYGDIQDERQPVIITGTIHIDRLYLFYVFRAMRGRKFVPSEESTRKLPNAEQWK